MKRELRISGDGSHTFYVPSMDENYHSLHGALQESLHVFIENGFHFVDRSPLRILEIGFGTGLNALLTLAAARRLSSEVFYHTVEKYPLAPAEYERLNYDAMIPELPEGSTEAVHRATWGEQVELSEHFILFKEMADFREMDPDGYFDLVYFDAFSPERQPHLWTKEIFSALSGLMLPGAVLVTYSSKGSLRRALNNCGFEVEKIPGPPGKREMTRAIKS